MYNCHNSTQSKYGYHVATYLDSKTDYTTIYSLKSSVRLYLKGVPVDRG